jgi:hypothetical protein
LESQGDNRGLVFNDNGTVRMDCDQVNDGVTEQAVGPPWQVAVSRPKQQLTPEIATEVATSSEATALVPFSV